MYIPRTTSSSSLLNNNSNHCTTTFGKRPLQKTIIKSPSTSKQIQQDTSTSIAISPSSKTTRLVLTTEDLYTLLKHLQKTEFFMCWIIALLRAVTSISPSLPVMCLKLSAFTRSIAYVVDFTNVIVKLDSSIPMWLVLHHSGVQHITKAFFLTPSSQYRVILFALASCGVLC